MTISIAGSSVRAAYDALAADYDAFTTGYAHNAWFARIHSQLRLLGLTGDRALDLACGTGKSTLCLVDAGYRVQACDISPRMVEVARQRLPGLVDELFVADIRELPSVSEVDLVLCLDDAINYLLDPEDLVAALRGVRRALRTGGFVAFDVNTLATYRSTFSQCFVREAVDHFFAWRGQPGREMEAGGFAVAEIEAFSPKGDRLYERATSRHEQRHHPENVVVESCESAGLRCLRIDGQKRGGVLEQNPDELTHIKFVYYAQAL